MSESRNNEITTRGRAQTLPTRGRTHRTTEFRQLLRRRTNDAMSHEESHLELDAFPDWQPVKFIADGGRNTVELRNTQYQPRSRVQDGLKSVEKISIRPVEDTVAMIDSACDEGVHERQQGLFR